MNKILATFTVPALNKRRLKLFSLQFDKKKMVARVAAMYDL